MDSSRARLPCPSPTPGVYSNSSIESVMPSSHLILCRPLLLLPPIPLSIRVFSNESTLCMRWPKYWSFSFSISPSKEQPGQISFNMLSRLVITFLPRSKRLFISRLQSPSAVILEPPKNKVWELFIHSKTRYWPPDVTFLCRTLRVDWWLRVSMGVRPVIDWALTWN